MKTFIIRYYHTETQYRCGLVCYSETVKGTRELAVNTAQNKIRATCISFMIFKKNKKKQTKVVCFLTF